MALSLDIVVPTHDGWELTERCLARLREQDVPHALIVADDASTDGTPERVRAAFPEARVVELASNRGFAAACNAGIGAGSGDVVLLLNNDVECEPGFLAALSEPFAGERVGGVAPLLLRPDGAIDSVGLAVDPTLAGFPRLQGLPASEAAREMPVLAGPAGAAAAYRRVALEEAGPFDERIFLYQEDLDLALRVRAAGWEVRAAPAAAAVHLGSATAGRRSAWQRERSGFSRGYLLRRYGTFGPRAAATETIVCAGDLVLSRDLAALRGRLAGWRAARGLPRRQLPEEAVDGAIGFRESLRLRRSDYAAASTSG